MQFIPAICPQCSGKLQVPSGQVSAQCEYCGTDVFVREVEKSDANRSAHLIELANAAATAGNHQEAFGYFTSVLEIDSKNVLAWVGKGTSAGYLSTLAHSRIPETMECYRTAVRLAENDAMKKVASMDCAVGAVAIANAYYQTSLKHTMEFIAVPDTPYEHATRCVEAVQLCKLALSLDPEVPGASDFIHTVASRTLKVGKLSADEKLFLAGEQSKHAPASSPASTSEKSADQTSADALMKFGMLLFFGATYAASYYLVKEMGVERTFWAILFAGFLTIPISTGVGLLGLLAVMKIRQKTSKAGA
ncbi:hypothetical protein LJR129_004920 [Acidovorax sp. LjRoot129]|uniref:hypothetical protein n=1 Tax=unclassified Acidovorax TaxID=2684926 RepID=UPI003ECF575D